MAALYYIFIAIVIIVGIWQVTNIFKLKDVIASDKDNQTQGKLLALFGISFYIFMIYGFIKWTPLTLTNASSEEGYHYDNLYNITMILIIVVQFFTQFLLFFFAYKYRGRKGQKALFYADSHKLEMIWTITPAVVLAVLIMYGLWTWNNVMDPSDAEDPLIVELYAKQFSWEARYAGANNTLGRANVRNIKGINTMGVDMNDVNSLDDVPSRELHLPKGRKVIFKFRSQDVLHSAYMPHFRAQMNCVPGMITQFAFTPNKTTEEIRLEQDIIDKVANINNIRVEKSKETGEELDPYEFDYLLLCNKICGASHYNMQMKIIVEEQADFDKWLSSQKTMKEIVKL